VQSLQKPTYNFAIFFILPNPNFIPFKIEGSVANGRQVEVAGRRRERCSYHPGAGVRGQSELGGDLAGSCKARV